ncbi:MAG: FAD-dependent monooxygenase [Rhodospirillales bacterium]|nr:FAD-dependent monooxygenase [Rhodospirillales bacterium]MYE82924.1 hypothetical protein [Gammaproteobacteria bacterium]
MINAPVCIIGCEPIGLASALVLAKFGIDSLLNERRDEVNTHPRSRFVDTNTMELMRFLGVAKAVEETGLGPDWTENNRWASALTGRQIAVIPSPTFHTATRSTSPTLPVMTCQDHAENVLLTEARASNELRPEAVVVARLREAVGTDDEVPIDITSTACGARRRGASTP